MVRRSLPPRDLVRQLLSYDAETGVLTWLPRPREMFAAQQPFQRWNSMYAGKPAGGINGKGYLHIRIGGARPYAHRLAWLCVHDEPVPAEIDHIDRNPLNNRINNLRAATRPQNRMNDGLMRNNTSGYRGVWASDGKFMACIRSGGKRIHLGTFETAPEAAASYRAAAIRIYGNEWVP